MHIKHSAPKMYTQFQKKFTHSEIIGNLDY